MGRIKQTYKRYTIRKSKIKKCPVCGKYMGKKK